MRHATFHRIGGATNFDRLFFIGAVAISAILLATHFHSGTPAAAVANPTSVSTTVIHTTPIQQSRFSGPTLSSSTSGATQQDAQAVAIDPAASDAAQQVDSTATEDQSPVIVIAPQTEAPTQDPNVQFGNGFGDQPVASWELSDQQVMNEYMSMMNPEQQVAFEEAWAAMTPDERQDTLTQMRLSMAGT